jgi:hypothetical protein
MHEIIKALPVDVDSSLEVLSKCFEATGSYDPKAERGLIPMILEVFLYF